MRTTSSRRRCWEFPQGTWSDGNGGSAEELARAVLAEETGLRAAGLRHLGHLDLAPGLSDQEFDVWLATGLTAGPTNREATESDMRQRFVPEAELRRMIRAGAFTDGSIAGRITLTAHRRPVAGPRPLPGPGRGRRRRGTGTGDRSRIVTGALTRVSFG